MRITPLTLEDQIATGANFEVQYEHPDLSNATIDGTQILAVPIAAKMSVRVVRNIIDVPFKNSASAANNSTLLSVGDGAAVARFLTSTELNENGTEVLVQPGVAAEYVYLVDDTIDLLFTPKTGSALQILDTGRARLYLRINDLRAVAPAA